MGALERVVSAENLHWAWEKCLNIYRSDDAWHDEWEIALSDYVPFYFTHHSPMLYNIKTGYHGMRQTPMPEIVSFLHAARVSLKTAVKPDWYF